MTFLNIGSLFFCLPLLCACSSAVKSEEAHPAMENVTQRWEVLVSGTQCAIDKPQQMLIKTDADFDKIWKGSQSGIDMGPAKPKVDFSKKWVVAGFLGWVNSAGHKLEIKSIEAESSTTVITLLHKRPGSDCINAQVIEFPYVFASINHFSPEKVEFKATAEDVKCK